MSVNEGFQVMKKSYKKVVKKLFLMKVAMFFTASLVFADDSEDRTSVPTLQRPLMQRNGIKNPEGSAVLDRLDSSTQNGKPMKMQGWIRIADAKDYVPEIRIYFKGMESFNNREGFLSFPLDNELQEIGVIFTKNIDYKHHKRNTLRELIIKKSENYRYFTLTKDSDNEWVSSENTKRRNNFLVPHDAVVVLVNPACFKKFEPSKIKFADNILSLPRIVLKGGKIRLADNQVASKAMYRGCSTYRDWIEYQGKQSLLHSLGLTQYHEQVREEYKDMPEGRGMIALTQYS